MNGLTVLVSCLVWSLQCLHSQPHDAPSWGFSMPWKTCIRGCGHAEAELQDNKPSFDLTNHNGQELHSMDVADDQELQRRPGSNEHVDPSDNVVPHATYGDLYEVPWETGWIS